jgi:hypothetical protein
MLRRCARPGRALAAALLLVLAGCGEPAPVPPEYADFVGVWELNTFGASDTYRYLKITASGYLSYARLDRTATSLSCVHLDQLSIKEITPTRITAKALHLFTTEFEIGAPPAKTGSDWHMTVDGQELVRTHGAEDTPDYSWECGDGELKRKLKT